MIDEFTTIPHAGHAETRILGSRFLADAVHSGAREEAEVVLQGVRKKLYDASHHCFAYRLGCDGLEFRFSDDGEPGGTAGKPILAAIDREGVTDVLVVVTRYFGGTKLGTGGLVRAYGETALLAVRDAGRATRLIYASTSFAVGHSLVSQIMHVASRCGGRIADTRYDDLVHYRIEVRRSRLDAFRSDLVQATSGGVQFED
jgi:uncharacterized YigZ family protein